jgi:hypothetical protein
MALTPKCGWLLRLVGLWTLSAVIACGTGVASAQKPAGPDAYEAATPDGALDGTVADGPIAEGAPEADVVADARDDGGPHDAEAPDSGEILTVGNGLIPDPSCSGMPPAGFGFEAGTETCFQLAPDAGASGVTVCLPDNLTTNPSDPWRNTISACAKGSVGGLCSNSRQGAFCCDGFPAARLTPPYCASVGTFRYLAYGQLVDTDGDQIPDLFDNCPTVPNSFQQDADKDGIGDVCDDCPYTYNPDQAAQSDGGIGNACNCALTPAPPLGPDGCPCGDSGAVHVSDAGDLCGLVSLAGGGVSQR